MLNGWDLLAGLHWEGAASCPPNKLRISKLIMGGQDATPSQYILADEKLVFGFKYEGGDMQTFAQLIVLLFIHIFA